MVREMWCNKGPLNAQAPLCLINRMTYCGRCQQKHHSTSGGPLSHLIRDHSSQDPSYTHTQTHKHSCRMCFCIPLRCFICTVSSGQNCLPSLKYLSDEEINTKRDVSQTSQDEEDLVWSDMGVNKHITICFFNKKATDKCSQMCVYQLLLPTQMTKT